MGKQGYDARSFFGENERELNEIGFQIQKRYLDSMKKTIKKVGGRGNEGK